VLYCVEEWAVNRIASNSDAPAAAKVDAVAEGEFESEPATRFERDAEFGLAVGEDGFQLRIAFEASRHVAHRRARRLLAGHVAGLILAPAGLVELLPALHEMIGAAARIGAQFGFELERAHGAADLAASRLAGQFRVLLVRGFGTSCEP
jgi:hypothetical protein